MGLRAYRFMWGVLVTLLYVFSVLCGAQASSCGDCAYQSSFLVSVISMIRKSCFLYSFLVLQVYFIFCITVTFDQQVAHLVTAFVNQSTRLNSIQKIHLFTL
jgi:hypothetical protein